MIDTTTSKLKVYHLENPLTLVKRRLFILKQMEQQDDNSDYIVLNPGEELCSMNIPESDIIFSYQMRWHQRTGQFIL